MASYTIEDIELIRRKSGISYQEAVALLDYHNGNVARALVDLERNGRIKPEAQRANAHNAAAGKPGQPGQPGKSGSSAAKDFTSLLNRAYRARIKVNREATPILNVSLLFALLSVLISPHLVIIGAIVCLVLGYRFTFTKKDPAFAEAKMEKMVRSAADNVRSSVNDFARSFQEEDDSEPTAAQEVPPAKKSYYEAHPTASSGPRPGGTHSYSAASQSGASGAAYRPNVPTLNVPVQVESQDGSVTIQSESDGYSSATVE